MIGGNISHIDLVPTLLDLMGELIPDHLQGESRVSVLNGDATLSENDVFIQWNRSDGHPRPGEAEVNPAMSTPWRSVISADRWKLNLSAHDQCELYDLNADPYETVNYFHDPRCRDRIRNLTERIRQWQVRTDDGVPLPEI